ncbi:glycosyltransferase family 2 protein [Methanophagales archaeon]|nr:MAG: glycosyltransferase family 2 protein [Methanophagales archaeon]
MDKPIISAIIPTYNRCKYLKGTILSLQHQSLPKDQYEIIVADSNSSDDTSKVVEETNICGEKEVIYIKDCEPGLHSGRHAGAKIAQGEILAYTDDDAICDPNWLSELIKPYSNPEVGCVGGKILPKWEVKPPDWIEQYWDYLSLLDWGDEVKELKTPEIYGCNFSIRKSVLFEVGGFNPDSFGDIWLGDGETGLLRKVLSANYKIVYTPEAVVWHVIPESRLTIEYMKRRFANEGACSSYTLHYGNRNLGKMRLLFYFNIFGLRALACSLLAAKSRFFKKTVDYYKYLFTSSYYKSRCLYELRLIYDNKLRKLVEREDWIN